MTESDYPPPGQTSTMGDITLDPRCKNCGRLRPATDEYICSFCWKADTDRLFRVWEAAAAASRRALAEANSAMAHHRDLSIEAMDAWYTYIDAIGEDK